MVLLTAVVSGFSVFINKFAVSFSNPYIFTWLKNLTAAVFLSALLLLAKDWKTLKKVSKKEWFLLVFIGLIGGCIPFLLFFRGLSLISPSWASFWHKTMFLYAGFLAWIFLKEKISKEFLLGSLVLLTGNLILLKKLSFSFSYGDFLIILAAIFWAIENTLSKYVLKTLNGRIVAWARMFFGSLFMLIFFLTTNQISLIGSLNAEQLIWVVVTSIFLLAYVLFWYNGLKSVPLSQATAILFLGSLITTFLNFVSEGKINSKEIFSGLLICAGIILIIGLKKVLESAGKIKNYLYVRS